METRRFIFPQKSSQSIAFKWYRCKSNIVVCQIKCQRLLTSGSTTREMDLPNWKDISLNWSKIVDVLTHRQWILFLFHSTLTTQVPFVLCFFANFYEFSVFVWAIYLKMLDLFTIFTKGGIVLWCFRGTQEIFTAPVNALIRSVILQVIWIWISSFTRKRVQSESFFLLT